jgi:hypothetical protein
MQGPWLNSDIKNIFDIPTKFPIDSQMSDDETILEICTKPDWSILPLEGCMKTRRVIENRTRMLTIERGVVTQLRIGSKILF